MNSLRSTLLVWLLTVVVLASAVQAIILYRVTLNETEELFDYHIQQLALSMRDQVLHESPVGVVVPEDESEYDFVVQIWGLNGERLYRSRPSSTLPNEAIMGFSNVRTPEGEWRMFSIRLRDRVIQVAQPMGVRSEMALAISLRTLTPLLLIVPLLALAIWFAVGRALRPIENIANAVERRHATSLDPLPEEKLPEEIAPLVGALNRLLARLSQSISAQQAFIGDAAHDLRSPLTALRLQAQLVARARDDKSRESSAAILVAGIDRATRLVEQLLTLARSEPDVASRKFESVRLDELVLDVVAQHAELAHNRRIDLGVGEAEQLSVSGDADSLRILLRNLMDNAIRHTPQGGRIDASVLARNGCAVIEVADSGPGIPAEERERVLDRFYRRPGNDAPGSGLGLAIVKAIAERHGAAVELADAPGGGLAARIVFGSAPGSEFV